MAFDIRATSACKGRHSGGWNRGMWTDRGCTVVAWPGKELQIRPQPRSTRDLCPPEIKHCSDQEQDETQNAYPESEMSFKQISRPRPMQPFE